mmetsp:Transcript_49856/g.106024  ORF Transcript_49856/g.106024 Transcript_49856/m.106024 type:complete len:202 (-) Transcript_49856:264-869(-)
MIRVGERRRIHQQGALEGGDVREVVQFVGSVVGERHLALVRRGKRVELIDVGSAGTAAPSRVKSRVVPQRELDHASGVLPLKIPSPRRRRLLPVDDARRDPSPPAGGGAEPDVSSHFHPSPRYFVSAFNSGEGVRDAPLSKCGFNFEIIAGRCCCCCCENFKNESTGRARRGRRRSKDWNEGRRRSCRVGGRYQPRKNFGI